MVTANRGSQQLDSQGTPRYATFNSTKVLICGYPEADAGALSKAIEQEGGKVLKKYYKGSRPDVIVCGTVADRNCKVSSAADELLLVHTAQGQLGVGRAAFAGSSSSARQTNNHSPSDCCCRRRARRGRMLSPSSHGTGWGPAQSRRHR